VATETVIRLACPMCGMTAELCRRKRAMWEANHGRAIACCLRCKHPVAYVCREAR